MLPRVLPKGNFQGIDISQIDEFDKIVDLFIDGFLKKGDDVITQEIAQGTAPHSVEFLPAADATEFATESVLQSALAPYNSL